MTLQHAYNCITVCCTIVQYLIRACDATLLCVRLSKREFESEDDSVS